MADPRRTVQSPETERLLASLVAARVRRGLSQRALSQTLGLHPATMGKIERGERAIQVSELVDICRALGESPSRMLEESLRDEGHEA